MNTLRELRLWHWRHAMNYRSTARLLRTYRGPLYHPAAADHSDWLADTHIKAVQILNDAPECQGSTAEQDNKS